MNFNLFHGAMTTTVMTVSTGSTTDSGWSADDRAMEYDDVFGLMSLMTGDEKHTAAATSTLDVIRVLYDRVLDVSPETVGDPGRDRFYLSKGHGPMAYYAMLADQGLLPGGLADRLGRLRLAARLPPRPQPGAGRGDLLAARSGTGSRSRWVRRSACAPRASTSRVVVLVGDAELDEGSNHEALELAAALRLDALTVVVVDNRSSSYAVPGRIAAAVRGRGLARRHRRRPDHDVRSRRPCRTVRRPPERRRRPRGGEVMNPRTQFAATAADLVETDPSVALVYAEISGQFFGDVERRHPDRVVNVGIREQLLVNVGAGLALTGMRPIVHTFGSFLVERAFEQIKLGFGHQDVGGVPGRCGRFVRHRRRGPHPPVAGRRRADGHAAGHAHPRPRHGRRGRRRAAHDGRG